MPTLEKDKVRLREVKKDRLEGTKAKPTKPRMFRSLRTFTPNREGQEKSNKKFRVTGQRSAARMSWGTHQQVLG